jgi:hypothetical protein
MNRSIERALTRMQINSPAATLVGPIVEARRDIAASERRRLNDTKSLRTSNVFEVSAQSVVDLGSYQGENITGIRLSVHGRITSPSGFWRIRPNGGTSFSANGVQHITYWDGASQLTAARYGSSITTSAGLSLGVTDWGTSINDISSDSIFFTKTGAVRYVQSHFTNADLDADGNRMVTGYQSIKWHDSSTPVTSLTFALDGGSFTGRISVEVMP